jgi:fatty acid desaturase
MMVDDLTRNFSKIATVLKNSEGIGYHEYKRQLTPYWIRVLLDITLIYLALGLLVALMYYGSSGPLLKQLLYGVIGGLFFGYCIQSLSLFMHEAAHFNIAPGRDRNDLLADVFLGVIQVMDIKAYRKRHWQHHRSFGFLDDTENHYVNRLDHGFFFSTLSGYKTLLEVRNRLGSLLSGNKQVESDSEGKQVTTVSWVMLTGILLHGLVLGTTLLTQKYALFLAWGSGMFLFFPLLSMLRQLLEHRGAASSEGDMTYVEGSALTRNFGVGPLSCTFGAAGFNRHLLHHWDPQVSYTRFHDMEKFLLDTQVADILTARKSSYTIAFKELWGK